MSFFARFSGSVAPDFVRGLPTANPAVVEPPSLQLLFDELPLLTAEVFNATLRAYHPTLHAANAETVNVADLPGAETLVGADGPPAAMLGLFGWGSHVVKLAAFAAPMPASAVEGCLQPALLPPEMKADARKHAAHILLYYAGFEVDPLEQIVAVAAVAGVLAEFRAIVTLNEEARTAVPSVALLPDDAGEDMLATLRSLPLPYLYAGFVKMDLTDIPGVWIRTFAAGRFDLPNLAYHAAGHGEGQGVFHLFSGLLGYLRETGLKFEPGEVIRIDEDLNYSVRTPEPAEWWLDSTGPLWVLEKA